MEQHSTRLLVEKMSSLTSGKPRIFTAPGRVNLIGEHTDYNDGFVLPAAINFLTTVAIVPRPERSFRVISLNLNETAEFETASASRKGNWADYVQGVAVALEGAGIELPGAELLIHSEVPIGAGLSSSAALEVSVAFALLAIAGVHLDRTTIARLCQRAENEFVGMNCGIMDQFIACSATNGHALMLDCRSLESRAVPIPRSVSLVVCNTMVRHKLAGSEYNARRQDCETASSLLGISSLRDISMQDFRRRAGGLPDRLRKRAAHVISEDERVQKAAESLILSDLTVFGELMVESHSSLQKDYEVSCRELDLLVDLAMRQPGVYGARMTGGGFGGCTINLVDAAAAPDFAITVSEHYQSATGIVPEIYVCQAVGGAREVQSQ